MNKNIIGNILSSNNYGKFKITKDLGLNKNKKHMIEIQFIDTKYTTTCQYNNAINGKVKDPTRFLYDVKDNIYESNNYGSFKIIDYIGCDGKNKIVKIKFIDTGYECNVSYCHAIRGSVRDPKRVVFNNRNTIFNSKSGEYIIIDEIGYKNGNRYVKVKFLETGTELVCRYSNALSGSIIDPSKFLYDTKDGIYRSNNYGSFKIIGYNKSNDKNVRIKFINTGYEADYSYTDVINGEVRDYTYKNIFEARRVVGPTPMLNIDRYLNRTYYDIMRRCYNQSDTYYSSYGAKGVSVCDKWRNIDFFKFDLQNLPGWINKYNDPIMYQLDKDLLQINIPINKRVYSDRTCIWLPNELNLAISNGSAQINIIDNFIYQLNSIYFVKSNGCYPYPLGPFYNINDARSALRTNLKPINMCNVIN